MTYPKEYVIRFYDNLTMMKEETVFAETSKEALEIALANTKGLVSFDKIKIKCIG